MILVAPECLKQIVDAAEAAYPNESCGLLVGHDDESSRVRIATAHPSDNLASDPRRAFEVDPALRLNLHKRLRGGPDDVVGVYHSHPDMRAQPSETDLARAWEPRLVWIITSVVAHQAVLTTAHRINEAGTQFEPMPLYTDDWRDAPTRAPMTYPGLE